MAFQFGGSGSQRPTSGSPGGAPVPPGGAPIPPGSAPSVRSGGFQGTPTPRRPDAAPTVPAVNDDQGFNGFNRGQNWSAPQRKHNIPAGGYGVNIPWRIIIPVLLIAAAIALCVIYRDSITAFLSQILAWVITIIVIILLIRWLIFGGRRRR